MCLQGQVGSRAQGLNLSFNLLILLNLNILLDRIDMIEEFSCLIALNQAAYSF